MLLVTEIKTLEIDEDQLDRYMYYLTPKYDIPLVNAGKREFHDINYVRKLTYGRRYVKPNGDKLVIAYSIESEDVIGITFDMFEQSENLRIQTENERFNISVERNNLKKELNELKAKIEAEKKESNWQHYLRYGNFPNN